MFPSVMNMTPLTNKQGILPLLAIGLILGLSAVAATRRSSNASPIGDTSTRELSAGPAWELKDVNGKTIRSADFKGKVVILDFWATWCPPCRAEIPGFIELQKRHEKDGLVVIGVSLDRGGPALVKSFVEKNGVNYPVALSTEEIVRAFGDIESIPTTFILDREGRIVTKHEGYADKEEFEKDIKPLLKP
jgi:peroxiredoxin